MTIKINNKDTSLPVQVVTLADLAEHLHWPLQGTAVALNGKLASKDKWSVISLNEGDLVTVISAAFGG